MWSKKQKCENLRLRYIFVIKNILSFKKEISLKAKKNFVCFNLVFSFFNPLRNLPELASVQPAKKERKINIREIIHKIWHYINSRRFLVKINIF